MPLEKIDDFFIDKCSKGKGRRVKKTLGSHIYRSLEKLIKTHHLAPVQRNSNEKSFLCCDFAFFVYATIFAKLLSKKWRYRKVLIIIA
jgi:hypothetical protein